MITEGASMKVSWVKMLWAVPVFFGIVGMTVGTALAHEEREVWEYNFNIGWIDEPAYEGFMNGVELRVIRTSEQAASEESRDHHDGDDGDSDEGMTSRGDGDGDACDGSGGDDAGRGDPCCQRGVGYPRPLRRPVRARPVHCGLDSNGSRGVRVPRIRIH